MWISPFSIWKGIEILFLEDYGVLFIYIQQTIFTTSSNILDFNKLRVNWEIFDWNLWFVSI